MNRLEQLLARALETGEIPAEASAAEREEIAGMVSAASDLRAAAATAEQDGLRAMPVARARFERFVAAPPSDLFKAPATASRAVGHRWGWRYHWRGRQGLTGAGVAVVAGIVAILSVFAYQSFSSTTESVSALSTDDYVQVEGVVASTSHQGSGQTVVMHSELGDMTIQMSEATHRADEQASPVTDALKPGDVVLVGGTVVSAGPRRTIDASTIVVGRGGGTIATPKAVKLKELKRLVAGLQGRVRLLTLAKDGGMGRVIVEVANGQRYVVRVDNQTVDMLLNRTSTAIGAPVTVTDGDVANDGIFGLRVDDAASNSTGRPRLGFSGVRGVVSGREGDVLEVVDSKGVTVPVVIQPRTVVLLGRSGLTRADIGKPSGMVGHTVAISGGFDTGSGRMMSDVVVVGPEFRRP